MDLEIVFAIAAVMSAVAAMIAAFQAGKAKEGVRHLTLEVNSRLDQLLAGAQARGELKGREDERDDRAEDSEGNA